MVEEISIQISKLRSDKAYGDDKINAVVLKRYSDKISFILAELFNKCVLSGVFPATLKTAIVTPIFKEGKIEEYSNYRPISILSLLSKIFEKLISMRITSFLMNTKLLILSNTVLSRNHLVKTQSSI